MLKNIITPFISLVCFLIVASVYSNEWIAWISIAVFGVIILNELTAGTAGSDVLNTKADFIILQLDLIMTKQERLDKAIADLNAGTNDIAADLIALKEQIAAGNVTEESLATLETNIAVLQELGNAQ